MDFLSILNWQVHVEEQVLTGGVQIDRKQDLSCLGHWMYSVQLKKTKLNIDLTYVLSS